MNELFNVGLIWPTCWQPVARWVSWWLSGYSTGEKICEIFRPIGTHRHSQAAFQYLFRPLIEYRHLFKKHYLYCDTVSFLPTESWASQADINEWFVYLTDPQILNQDSQLGRYTVWQCRHTCELFFACTFPRGSLLNRKRNFLSIYPLKYIDLLQFFFIRKDMKMI